MEKLSEYRKNIKSGDLIAYKSRYRKGWTSWLGFMVSLFSMSRYSHVGIALWLGERLFLVSADIPEVKLELITRTNPFHHIALGMEWSDRHTEELLKHLGEPYSIIEAIRGYMGSNDETNNKWFCTEFARVFYQKFGYEFGDDLTPQGIVDDMLVHGAKTITYVDSKS